MLPVLARCSALVSAARSGKAPADWPSGLKAARLVALRVRGGERRVAVLQEACPGEHVFTEQVLGRRGSFEVFRETSMWRSPPDARQSPCRPPARVEGAPQVPTSPEATRIVDDVIRGRRKCSKSDCPRREPKPGAFKVCSRSKRAQYCDRKCQAAAWAAGYKYLCERLCKYTEEFGDVRAEKDK